VDLEYGKKKGRNWEPINFCMAWEIKLEIAQPK
jgi:hypothetical protein